MTLKTLTEKTSFEIINQADFDVEITKPFTCDLLSVCMSKASAGCVWVTCMGNVNAIAVAVLTDTACIILAEGGNLDETALQKAKLQGVNVLKSKEPIFETAMAVQLTIDNGYARF